MKMIHTIKRLISTSEQRNSYIFQVVSICIIGLLTVVSSFALGSITQNIIDTTFEKMMLSFVIFILTSAAVTLLDWKRSKHLVKMIENIKMNYREKTAKTVLTGEFSRVQPIPLGDIVSRVNTDVNLAANGCELIITGLRNILIPIVLSVILLMINWRMAIGYIFPVALIFLYQRITKNAQDGIMPWRVDCRN
jgi:ABC-type multidrug transport system fused ATPase/permease subunit